MNSIKTCVFIGKIDVPLICDALINTAHRRINSENYLVLVRFLEIFNSLLFELKNDPSLSPQTELFALYCSKFIQSDIYELRCSITSYYLEILTYDYCAFTKNQKEIWESFNLPSKIFSDSDLETESNY